MNGRDRRKPPSSPPSAPVDTKRFQVWLVKKDGTRVIASKSWTFGAMGSDFNCFAFEPKPPRAELSAILISVDKRVSRFAVPGIKGTEPKAGN